MVVTTVLAFVGTVAARLIGDWEHAGSISIAWSAVALLLAIVMGAAASAAALATVAAAEARRSARAFGKQSLLLAALAVAAAVLMLVLLAAFTTAGARTTIVVPFLAIVLILMPMTNIAGLGYGLAEVLRGGRPALGLAGVLLNAVALWAWHQYVFVYDPIKTFLLL